MSSESASAYAPSNIALCKYWGKRQDELNLPVNSSLSVSMAHMGTSTKISLSDKDEFFFNGEHLKLKLTFSVRLKEFLDMFRTSHCSFFRVESYNTIPTGAGLASSASGFAALTLALNKLFDWSLLDKELSILARLGSGSACRSIHRGFVLWHKGKRSDGMDSYSEKLEQKWPDLRMGVIHVSEKEKQVSSRDGMKRTVKTADFYRMWAEKSQTDLATIIHAINTKDFSLLGETAESNALAMHATMLSSKPPLLYWLPSTVSMMRKVWDLRKIGIEVYLTIDAGPNVKLIFLQSFADDIRNNFPQVDIISPFSDNDFAEGND